jgi:hypothetical protein
VPAGIRGSWCGSWWPLALKTLTLALSRSTGRGDESARMGRFVLGFLTTETRIFLSACDLGLVVASHGSGHEVRAVPGVGIECRIPRTRVKSPCEYAWRPGRRGCGGRRTIHYSSIYTDGIFHGDFGVGDGEKVTWGIFHPGEKTLRSLRSCPAGARERVSFSTGCASLDRVATVLGPGGAERGRDGRFHYSSGIGEPESCGVGLVACLRWRAVNRL